MPNTAAPSRLTRAQTFALRSLVAAGVPESQALGAVVEEAPTEYIVAHRCDDGTEILTRALTHAQAKHLAGELREQGARAVCFESCGVTQ